MPLWAAMPGPKKTGKQRYLKARKSKVGESARMRQNKANLSANEQDAIRMMRELKRDDQIAKEIGSSHVAVRMLRSRVFGRDRDPYRLHVVESYRNGESAKAIGRRLLVETTCVSRILKSVGIDVGSLHKTKMNITARRREAASSARKDRAEDLYCMLAEVGSSIESVALETGFHPAFISSTLNHYIPDYANESRARRDRSRAKIVNNKRREVSLTYRTENEFSDRIKNILKEYGPSMCVRRSDVCPLEIDVKLDLEWITVLIELKVTSKKKEIARAVGQLLIQESAIGAKCEKIACFPSDVDIMEDMVGPVGNVGVLLCDETSVAGVVASINRRYSQAG